MMSSAFESFVRKTQIRETGQSQRSKSLSGFGASSKTASGSVSAIRPFAQTPFDKFIADSAFEDELETDATEDSPFEDPADDFPDPSDFPLSPGGGEIGGSAPGFAEGGTDEAGNFVGTPPVFDHGQIIDGDSNSIGSGSGSFGRLYACGRQNSGEFGLGVPGAESFERFRVVPSVPLMRSVFSATNSTFCIAGNNQLLVAGEALESEGQLFDAQNLSSASLLSASSFIRADQSTSLQNIIFRRTAPHSSDVIEVNPSEKIATSHILLNPTVLHEFKFNNINFDNITINDAFNGSVLKIYRGANADFLSGNAQLFSQMSFDNNSGSFRSEGGVALPADNYIFELEYNGSEQARFRRSTSLNFPLITSSVGTYVFSNGSWSQQVTGAFNSPVNPCFDMFSANEEPKTVRRIFQAVNQGFSSGGSNTIFGVKVGLRSVFDPAKIGVRFFEFSQTSDGASFSELGAGLADVDPENFPGGAGEVEILLSNPLGTASNILFCIETFGSSYEVAARMSSGPSEFGGTIYSVFEDGSILQANRSISQVLNHSFIVSSPLNATSSAFGRNLGVFVSSSEIDSFVLTAETSGFSRIVATQSGAIGLSGNSVRATGETQISDTELFEVVSGVRNISHIATDGNVLLAVNSSSELLYAAKTSSANISAFTASSSLRKVALPFFVSRSAITETHAVVRGNDGRLRGVGKAKNGNANALPGVGVDPALAPSTIEEFELLTSSSVAPDAFDVGGDSTDGFTVYADQSGVYIAGRVPGGSYESDHFELISTVSNVRKVSCGRDHFLLLTQDGDLWVGGSNAHGQLGLPLAATEIGTIPVPFAGGFADCHAGDRKSFVIAA